jgi:NADH-quinone oxidoreductase subunit N
MEISIPFPGWQAIAVVAPEMVVLFTALLVMMVDLLLDKARGGAGSAQKMGLAWISLVGVLAAAMLSYYLWDGSDRQLQDMVVADGYALFLKLVILIAAALSVLFSLRYVVAAGLAQGEYYTLLLLSSGGMMLMAAAINLMTIFLALEILSLALYILVGLDRRERRSGEAAFKYFLLGAFASGFLLYGMALIYGQVGTTSLAAVRDFVAAPGAQVPTLLLVGFGLMVVGFGFKVALVPFQMWTPDVYQGAPTPVTGFMSVGAKTAGLAALGRVALYAFGGAREEWVWVLAVLSALTMTVGNLAALRQTNLKRLLAYSSIAHAGYLLVGIVAGNALGVSGLLFYLFIYAWMNVAAFAVLIAVGQCEVAAGAGPSAGPSFPGAGFRAGDTLVELTGLAARHPWLSAAMALLMLSLAGIPPLAGFLGKLYLFSAAVQAGFAWLAILGVLNSVISAYYYLRVVAAMYMEESGPAKVAAEPACPALYVGVGLAAVAILLLGLWPAPIMNLARMTVAGLLGG